MKQWGIHILAWMGYIGLEYLANVFHYRSDNIHRLWVNILIFLPAIILSTYLVAKVLVPRFLLKKNYEIFSLGVAGVLLFVFFSRYFITNWEFSLFEYSGITLPFSKVVKNVIKDYAIIALGSCVLIINDWRLVAKRMRAVEQTNAELELALLMNKLQPHFLFNTFNNIYALIRKDPGRGAEALLQLSSVLEYIVYLKPAEKVAIGAELEIIRQYVGLQRLKYGAQLDYQECVGAGVLSHPIPSLVLLSLVENAFKHGSISKRRFLLRLETEERGGALHIRLSNTFNGRQPTRHQQMGNENLRNRLAIFYGEKAKLECSQEKEIFKVVVKIPDHEL